MAEYRAQIRAASLARKRQLAEDRAAVRVIQKAETIARREAKYAATADRRREQQRAWREANPGRMRELVSAWRARNPDKRRADRKSRKIAKRRETIKVLMKLQRGRCAICRDKLTADLHIDHIMPRKLGGSNARSNLQLTCIPCNLTKSAQHPIDHARTIGRLL